MSSQLNQDKPQELTIVDRIFRDREGNIVIIQPPNLPILVGVSAFLLQIILPTGTLHTVTSLIAFGVLFTWAWEELFQGVNYFRRSLGLIVLIGLIAFGLRLG